MFYKPRKQKGAILFEAVLAMTLNLMFLLGGLELGWYFHIRESMAGAAGQAVMHTKKQHSAAEIARIYMTGIGFPDSLLDELEVVSSTENTGGPKNIQVERVTVSLPLSSVLLFGGAPSKLGMTTETTVIATAYMREPSNKQN